MDFDEFYVNQAGNGFPVYGGARYQKGNSFLGRFVKGSIWPLLKKVMPYLGGKAVATGSSILDDMKQGKSFKTAAKRRLADTAVDIADDALITIKSKRQKGAGLRRAPVCLPVVKRRQAKSVKGTKTKRKKKSKKRATSVKRSAKKPRKRKAARKSKKAKPVEDLLF